MQANELRIGNLIQLYRKPEDKDKTIETIKSVYYYDERSWYYAEISDGFVVNIDTGILPIELTEEWLVKLGFSGVNVFSLKNNEWFLIWNKKNSFTYDHECYQIEIPDIELKYVHQLQNLYFALTGKELVYEA